MGILLWFPILGALYIFLFVRGLFVMLRQSTVKGAVLMSVPLLLVAVPVVLYYFGFGDTERVGLAARDVFAINFIRVPIAFTGFPLGATVFLLGNSMSMNAAMLIGSILTLGWLFFLFKGYKYLTKENGASA